MADVDDSLRQILEDNCGIDGTPQVIVNTVMGYDPNQYSVQGVLNVDADKNTEADETEIEKEVKVEKEEVSELLSK
jgi:hypothetical protein